MHYSTIALCLLAGGVKQGLATYILADDYAPSNFFSMFSFFDTSDPTHGFVQYLDESTAQADGLISTSGSSVYMGVDHTNVASNAGRNSVRITSNKAYEHGLVILDAAHMPEGCGTWPAFWMVGPNWPNQGEIDIIEGVNDQIGNAMTLHTGPNCAIANSGFTGTMTTSNCYVNAPGQSNNAGCGISNSNSQSYGSGFNSIQGGVYATEWTSSGISVWFFPRSVIPSDIASGNPNPSGWGTPAAHFAGSCDIDATFKDLQIVFDTTFCGDWAGAVWGTGSCGSKASTCQDYVQNNPSAFANAYWSINSLKVYQDNGVQGNSVQTTSGGPTGVPDSSLATVAPIPTATNSIPFSSTASFWDGEGWAGAPTPAPATSAAPTEAAKAAAAPATLMVPAPSTTFATSTTQSVVFWDGEGWDDAPTPTPTAAPDAEKEASEPEAAEAPAPAPSQSMLIWEGGDLPGRRHRRWERRHAKHLLAHNHKLHGNRLA